MKSNDSPMSGPSPRRAGNSESKSVDGTMPNTHWSKFAAVHGGVSPEQHEALSFLMEQYCIPFYWYARRWGVPHHDADDLVQSFFIHCLNNGFFARADREMGRFRNFLLRSVKHFMANRHRARVTREKPSRGPLLSIEEMAPNEGSFCQSDGDETPEAKFHRDWAMNLTHRTLTLLHIEWRMAGKEKQCKLFKKCLEIPILNGVKRPAMAQLAELLDLSEGEANDKLLTARRAFRRTFHRLLEEEMRKHRASDAQMSRELRDVFAYILSHRTGRGPSRRKRTKSGP